MIWTVIQINLRRLLHSRVELLLTFVVPLAFFSIFAVIFGSGVGAERAPSIKVLAVDLAATSQSAAVLQQLRQSPGLQFMTLADDDAWRDSPAPRTAAELDETAARRGVRRGQVSVAILLEPAPHRPPGATRRSEPSTGGELSARLLADSSDAIAGQLVSAVVRQTLAVANQRPFSAAPESRQAATAPAITIAHRPSLPPPSSLSEPPQMDSSTVVIEDVLGGDDSKPVVSMYAAGIAVMFLLFGASGGGGALLEEQENRTLDRLFATQLTMDQLLLGKWTYLMGLGVLQTTLMFLWGQAVFGVDLLGHWQGFLAMTLVTSGAAASFGLLLATLCRTRNQLNGLSVIVVLTMSALGGSMVPRYLMSENLQRAGLWTFNAWALDGYNKVFWRELPLAELWPQLAVLMISGFGFLMAARWLAVRWETH